MSNALRAWLEQHGADVPASLVTLMEHAVREADHGADESDATSLARAAIASLRIALRIGDDRAAAPHLLAADALLTAACAAAADHTAELHTLADRFAAHHIAELFPDVRFTARP